MRSRVTALLVLALIISGGATYLVYRVLAARSGTPRAAASLVLVATRELPLGTLIKESDLKLSPWIGEVPKTAVTKKDAILNRGVIAPIYEGEVIAENRLAPEGAGGGLSAIIPQGMRAVAVKVNEIVGVAGFVVPGMHVDVLISGVPPGPQSPTGAKVRTILQNIAVLSAGQNYQKDAEGKPVVVPVVNLLVNPDQAELLSLANNETKIQLVLRNPLDTESTKPPGIAVAALLGESASACGAGGSASRRNAEGASTGGCQAGAATTTCSLFSRGPEWTQALRGQFRPAPGGKTVNPHPSALVSFCILGLAAAGLQAQAPQQTARELTLTVGKSLVVNSAASIERVAVGFGDVAEARAITPKEVLLDGKAPGETSLIIWQEGGSKLFFDVVVRPNATPARTKLENLQRRIQEEVPGQTVQVSIDGDAVFLRGTVKDLLDAQRAAAIAATAGKVTNLLYVTVPPTDTQILLKVQFATVDRNVVSDLGLNLISTGGTNTVGRVSTNQFQAPAPDTVGGTQSSTFKISDALNIFLFRPDLNLGATIKALETRGLVEILAEPNVLAINGKQASFLSGGEFPYPILQGGGGGIGTVTVAFREFGVRINFLPVITPRGTIRLDVAPEVSALDYTAGLTIQGFTIPGLATRRVETEVELETGQSFAIGGLLDRRLTQTMEKIPLLSSVPLLGKLFQSRTLNKTNNELLVIVTPEIVHPAATAKMPQLAFPTPLWGDDKVPRTPGTNETGPANAAAGERIPVEQLMQQLKTESEMKLKQGKDLTTWPSSQPLPMPGSEQPPAAAPSGGPTKQ